MRVFIDGVERTNFKSGSLSIGEDINRRSRGRLLFYKQPNFNNIVSGQKIEIKSDDLTAMIFSGIINRPRQVSIGDRGVGIDAELLDNQAMGDRRIVIEAYQDKTVGFIVNDLYNKYLKDEGITLGTIETGQVVSRAVFPYVTLTRAFEDLTELSGYSWWITADKVLNFTFAGSFSAPWSITETSRPIRRIEVETDSSRYRNRQYLRAGHDITDTQIEKFTGDGIRRTFTVGYKLAQVPVLTLNGVAVASSNVGIRGVDQNKQWYWSKNEKEITQAYGATILTASDTLEISYKGFFPIVVISENSQAIQDRQSTEGGGTGLYESAEQVASIDSSSAALEFAEGKLRKYARVGTTLSFTTFKTGLRAGQLMSVNLPEFDVNSQFLITGIEISELANGVVQFSVNAVDGEDVGGWETFFKKLASTREQVVIRDNEVLVRLASQRESWAWSGSISHNRFACTFPSLDFYPRDYILTFKEFGTKTWNDFINKTWNEVADNSANVLYPC